MQQTLFVPQSPSKTLYRLAGAVALCIVLAALTDVLTSMGIEARDNRSVAVLELFALFQTRPFAAFSSLGLINILTLALSIPIYVAFNQVFRHQHPALAAFAAILFFLGTVVYLSSNSVFPLYALSRQYAAVSASQKSVLEAAGQALLAQGADLTPGTFVGLIFTQVAGVLITSAMLRSSLFGRWTGALGLAGFSVMILFFTLAAFFPEQYDTAILVSAPGGLLLIAYQILLARRFFQLGR